MSLPPGPKYLTRELPRLALPPGLAYIIYCLVCERFGIALPKWVLILGCLLSFPFTLLLMVQWRKYSNARNAAALGAVLPPRVEHKWLGGIDLVLIVSRSFDKCFLGDWLFNWSVKYGHMYAREVLFEQRIFTSEPEHIKAILSTNFQSFEKGPVFRNQMSSLLGTGVFNSDGEMWKFHRGMTRPFFNKDRICHFDIFDRHVDDAFRQMKARFKEGYSLDWQDLVSRFTLDSATEFLFGEDVRSLSAGLPYPPPSALAQADRSGADPANGFARAFAKAQLACLMRSRFVTRWPLFEFWADKAKKHLKTIDLFVDPILARLLKKKAERGALDVKDDESEDQETLLEHLVKLTDDAQVIKDETLNILIAGRDTTAATLTFAVYKLAQNPNILRRLRQEILEKIGSSRRPNYDDIKDMKFLRAVINETLRLYPSVPFNLRSTTEDTLLPSTTPNGKPYYIPVNTRIQYSVFVMHRRKDLWGPDALDFDPDRFLDDRVQKYLTRNPFIFLPFNAGPRICLGQQFAYNEISFMLIRLLQQFATIQLTPWVNPESIPPDTFTQSIGCDGKDTAWFSINLTMYVKHGLWLKMVEAPSSETATA